MIFETHAHYDDERFDVDRDEILQKVFNNGIAYILNPSSSPASIDRVIALAEKYERLYAAVGIHPHNAHEITEEMLTRVENLLSHPKVLALGEIGLDYYYDFCPKEIQQRWLLRQVEIAYEKDKPVIIHLRDATEDMLRLVKDSVFKHTRGVFHCFSGSLETARTLLDHGFYLSFGGPVTFKNAKKILELLQYIPLDRILLETDAPYLTPEPFRGKRNDSSYLHFICNKIAEVKQIPPEELAQKTLDNAKALFFKDLKKN